MLRLVLILVWDKMLDRGLIRRETKVQNFHYHPKHKMLHYTVLDLLPNITQEPPKHIMLVTATSHSLCHHFFLKLRLSTTFSFSLKSGLLVNFQILFLWACVSLASVLERCFFPSYRILAWTIINHSC